MYLRHWRGWYHMKLYTPSNHAPCHFMQSHIYKVHACLAVTCCVHFWQNDWGFLCTTAVTLGWNGYQNKSQHRKLTLEKKILPPLLQGFKRTTFGSWVIQNFNTILGKNSSPPLPSVFDDLPNSFSGYFTEKIHTIRNSFPPPNPTACPDTSSGGNSAASALQWFPSYLLDRNQCVVINNSAPSSSPLMSGVPQGSVLGPVLFVLYTTPLSDIIANHPVNHQLFADTTQLQKSTPPNDVQSHDLQSCTDDIKAWMCNNQLKLNEDKTETIFFSTPSLSSCHCLPSSVMVRTHETVFSDRVRNLGFILGSNFTMKQYVHIRLLQFSSHGHSQL